MENKIILHNQDQQNSLKCEDSSPGVYWDCAHTVQDVYSASASYQNSPVSSIDSSNILFYIFHERKYKLSYFVYMYYSTQFSFISQDI